VTPLIALLKNNSLSWTPTSNQSFQALKQAMCTTHVLSLPNFTKIPTFTKTFVLECDASGLGIGEILMQYGRPLTFTSKEFLDQHLGQSIYEKEMLAIFH
jgi:hypothetical protein